MAERKKELYIGHILKDPKPVSHEDIDKFFEGSDPMERIVKIELGYNDPEAEIVYYDQNGVKRIRVEGFKPFVWAKNSACIRMFGGDRGKLRSKLREYGIKVIPLYTCTSDNPYPHPKLDSGYKYLFQATHKMSFGKFQGFFNEAGTPLRNKKKNENEPSSQEFMYLNPDEQFMIETGKRYFKGFSNYDELKRMTFDLETEGLNPRRHHISQIGIRTNKGFGRIITIQGNTVEEKEENERAAIVEFMQIISEEKPDVILGHNSENFDWDFIMVRCEMYGLTLKQVSEHFLREGIYKLKRPTTLKLGGEVEMFHQTVIKYHNVVDSLHAVRRTMATDSSFELANLKYATKYLKLSKKNRVYVPGNQIDSIWLIKDPVFAFNDEDGSWYRISGDKPLQPNYVPKSGRYIVERYLLDDVWEADKVELALHQTDFNLTKILPTGFMRVCTMGTATQWKLIMLTWAYQNNLAVPSLEKNRRYTGGLSKLLITGYCVRICKGDYAALYPTTELTWNIEPATDIMHVMLPMLRYVLVTREHYKGLKKKSENAAEDIFVKMKEMDSSTEEYRVLDTDRYKLLADKIYNDNQQLVFKKFANSQFGSLGCPSVFPWGDLDAAEYITCCGRMLLRLMVGRMKSLGYKPIVGDSFTGDTPLFIKYDDGTLDIRPIEELIGKTEKDALGREYDVSEKPYSVLCRSGWMKPNYIYRHKTDKPIYRVDDGKSLVDVTEDHSLFNNNKEKVKPSQITSDTKLEYSEFNSIYHDFNNIEEVKSLRLIAKMVKAKTLNAVPKNILNATIENKKCFLEIAGNDITIENGYTKAAVAGIEFIRKCVDAA
jgi:DNA polymerase I